LDHRIFEFFSLNTAFKAEIVRCRRLQISLYVIADKYLSAIADAACVNPDGQLLWQLP